MLLSAKFLPKSWKIELRFPARKETFHFVTVSTPTYKQRDPEAFYPEESSRNVSPTARLLPALKLRIRGALKSAPSFIFMASA
jgi:hypothetical protein